MGDDPWDVLVISNQATFVKPVGYTKHLLRVAIKEDNWKFIHFEMANGGRKRFEELVISKELVTSKWRRLVGAIS
jgi:hypothetical protein